METKRKKELIEEIGMKFEEAMELFGEETLESMTMVNIVGGEGTNTHCAGAQCVSGCNNQCGGCGGGGTVNTSINTGTGGFPPVGIYFWQLCGVQIVCSK